MKKVIYNKSEQKVPIKLWIDDIESGALAQARNLSRLPFAFKHIAIMPDSHQGYGMPIGGVLATKAAIIPNAVGVDIGCGMCSLRTTLTDIGRESLKEIMSIIRDTVPVGFKSHSEQQSQKWMPDIESSSPLWDGVIGDNYEKATYQVGTLGGGNHFIEIQKGSDGYIWIMIHSGSRNIGYTVADFYNKKAVELNNLWESNNVNDDLAFFPQGSKWHNKYFGEMTFCIEFALANRKLMMHRVRKAFTSVLPTVRFKDFINKPHNFASIEHHYNTNVIVHRKGTTRARRGELGMIPGSQGTNSYIVEGLGYPDSFKSCSHGAGRTMSRTKAKKTLSLEEETKALEDKGILHAIRGEKDLDEAPGSYKDIEEVMSNQKDLVEIKVELKPLAVIKG